MHPPSVPPVSSSPPSAPRPPPSFDRTWPYVCRRGVTMAACTWRLFWSSGTRDRPTCPLSTNGSTASAPSAASRNQQVQYFPGHCRAALPYFFDLSVGAPVLSAEPTPCLLLWPGSPGRLLCEDFLKGKRGAGGVACCSVQMAVVGTVSMGLWRVALPDVACTCVWLCVRDQACSA